MNDKDKIATYYTNARELVKQNNPKAARAYVLAILNAAIVTHKNATSIMLRVKTEVFLDKWIAVACELYDKGITDYVLSCFGLPTKQEKELPKVVFQPPKTTPIKEPTPKQTPQVPISDATIDIAGLIDETAKTQGWCAEVFERNKTAVVEIFVSSTSRAASGTGFIISDKGYLITNDHVVFNEQTGSYYPKARMSFVGDKNSYKINVLFSDKKADVALCSFDPNEVKGYTVVKRIADYSQLKVGADCVVIGNAFGLGLSTISGEVRFCKTQEGDLVYSVLTSSGDSGAPVFNRQGECIGIHKSKTASVNGKEALGFSNATPMDIINQLLDKWVSANNIVL